MTRRQASRRPGRAVPGRGGGSHAGRRRRDRGLAWMPIGWRPIAEPHPGMDADWLVLATGWVRRPLLVLAGSAAAAARRWPPAGGRRRAGPPSRWPRAAGLPRAAGDRRPVRAGARTGRSAVPVRPALMGAVAGVLGVLAAFTFSAGVSDAAANPARSARPGSSNVPRPTGRTSGPPAGPARRRRRPDVIGVDDARIGGRPVRPGLHRELHLRPGGGQAAARRAHRRADARRAGRDRARPDDRRSCTPSPARWSGSPAGVTAGLTVTGIGFVPAGPHNGYADGAWLTPAGYDRLFSGAHYPFKFHVAAVALRPGADVQAVAAG